jgi:acetylornithine deacetylase/succinyl-diaminopimelate desuccinylase-like protein
MFASILDATPLLMGFGLPGDSLHGPDEHFSLRQFFRGIATSMALWEELGHGVANGQRRRKARVS